MIKSKKQMFIVIGVFTLVMLLGTVTYAFFNYTRTGASNNIKVGRISFVSKDEETITLSNLFPIDPENTTDMNDTTKVGTYQITIEGDTDYSGGIEYLLTVSNLNNKVGNKQIPIDLEITTTGIGDADDNYFTNHGGNEPIYTILNDKTVYNNMQLLAGYIPKGSTGVNGNVTIKAYIDKDKIAISDTYPESEPGYYVNTNMSSEQMNYCINYLINNLRFPSTNNIAISFCNNETTQYGTFQEVLDNNFLLENQLDDLLNHGVITYINYENGTTDEWVKGRTVFTTEEWNSLQDNAISFKVKVEANEGIWLHETIDSSVKKAISYKKNENICDPSWVDTEDNVIYLSGPNTCVDMNYVWYSGKLWRITAIYPDGAMKLITEDMITSIYWGSNTEYDGSWIYQWLNEDFYDTLVNPNNIVESNSIWNYSQDNNRFPTKPEKISTQKTKVGSVGLLNHYEYYNANRNNEAVFTYNSYLENGYYWWLLTPESNSYVWSVKGGVSSYAPYSKANGVRPSIVIKSGLEFTGNGTKTTPYKIVGDKEDAVNNTTLLSSRSVGEYVKFDNNIYRIVDTTGGITKLTLADYLSDSGSAVRKYYSSSVYYGKEGNTATDDYWDYYLNNTWYNNISTTYKNMLVDGTYYLGLYPESINYKATICKDTDLNSVTTKNCDKYTENDTDKTFVGKVGLQRVGEMFSSQLSKYESAQYIFTVTPNSNYDISSVSTNGYLYSTSPNNSCYVRPSITLKSGIKITGGTGYVGGDTNSPFEISE